MARRRHIGGDEDDDAAAMQYFFGGRGGGGQDINPMALAMQLLGMGQKAQEFQTSSGLSREEMEALNRYRMGGLEQAGQKTVSDIELAKAQMKGLQDETTARETEALARRAFEKAQLEGEQKKGEMALVKELIGAHPDWPLEKVMPLLAGYSDPMKQLMLAGKEENLANLAREKAALVHGVYGKPKELKTLLETLPPELLKRPEFQWQPWNEELAKQQSNTLTGGAGLAGALWNAPGAVANLQRGVFNKAMQVAMGKYAPELRMVSYTNPFEGGVGPSGAERVGNVASAALRMGLPHLPGGQTSLAEMIAPPIDAVQPGEYAPGAGFARQQQAPPAVDELLEMIAPQEAGFEYLPGGPSAMPPAGNEDLPWLRGNRWRVPPGVIEGLGQVYGGTPVNP